MRGQAPFECNAGTKFLTSDGAWTKAEDLDGHRIVLASGLPPVGVLSRFVVSMEDVDTAIAKAYILRGTNNPATTVAVLSVEGIASSGTARSPASDPSP